MIPLSFVVAVALAAEPSGDHQAPAPSLAEPSAQSAFDSQRQATLAELWQRRILSSDTRAWTSEDLALLQRMRQAEAAGAIALLRRRERSLAGLAAAIKEPGSKFATAKLTREGYDKWRSYRAQQALELFEAKGVDAKWAFELVDLEGQRLFDSTGMLTPSGENVFNRAAVNLPAWWKVPQTGDVFGTRPPPKPKPVEPEVAAPAAAPAPPTGGTRRRTSETSGSRNPAPGGPEVHGSPAQGQPQQNVPAEQPHQ